MIQMWPAHQQSLHNYIFKLTPKLLDDMRIGFFLLLSYQRKRFLQRLLEISFIGLELDRLLVDRVICQMHEQTWIYWRWILTRLCVFWVGHWCTDILGDDSCVVVLSCESGKALFIYEAL